MTASPARRFRRRPSGGPPAERASPLDHHVYGLHAVAAAVANAERRRHRLLATTNALRRLGTPVDVPVEVVDSKRLNRLLGADAVHQGVLLFCDPLPEPSDEEMAAARRLVVLDQVTDPHNVGAILRTAAAFAVDAVVVTARHSPRESAVLAKSAAGALDAVPLVRARNLAGALARIEAAGVRTIGLAADAGMPLEAAGIAEPFALVLGAEGKGLRQKTREMCSQLARIDMPGRMPSLNVSNAAALALYVADRASAGANALPSGAKSTKSDDGPA